MEYRLGILAGQCHVARPFGRLPALWSARSEVGMNFALSPEIGSIVVRTRAFVADEILPVEQDRSCWDEHENIRLDRLEPLRARAKLAGLWAPQTPRAFGGMGLS